MVEFTVVAITSDDSWLESIRPLFRTFGGSRFVHARSMEEGCRVLEYAAARLIVVDWSDRVDGFESMSQLLWANSLKGSPSPVLVIDNGYQDERALLLFRLGVDEYIARSEHLSELEKIVRLMLSSRVAEYVEPEHEAILLPMEAQPQENVTVPAALVTASAI